MREWLVAADDRTGAFEVAALFAQVVGPVTVTVGTAPAGSGVVDLGTRASCVHDAVGVAGAIDAEPSSWVAHKIDSTLRGNWAVELAARQRTTGRRVVVLPGWPEMGRTCVGGVVSVDGTPIGSVFDYLNEADLLSNPTELRGWLKGDEVTAVCDVPSSEAMHAAALVLAGHDVLVAGPAGPLGAVFAANRVTPVTSSVASITNPVLVVCGSANPVAREQIQRLQVARPDVEVITTEVPDGDLHPKAVQAIAAHARSRIQQLQPRTLVILGGETAAALLGDAPQVVEGFAAHGMPFISPNAGGPLVITKAGGFGAPDALVELLRGENG